MIGTVSTGKSFSHCLGYCLEDKQELTEEQKISQSIKDGLQHKNRAEVLEYNKCFGNRQELAEQFKDVRRLSKRVEKPVLHLSVRLAPGEFLDRTQLVDIGRELAKDFGVADNQYITVWHKDTNEQHIHLVANRVGYDGKAASTSNNYLKMDRFCRRIEREYKLKAVLSPRRFLSTEQRLIPRHDSRKERLRNDIRQALQKVTNYHEFEHQIKSLGYTIIKGRGISFMDDKKVTIKGSEVGFSLGTIEKILSQKNELALQQAGKKIIQKEKITEAGVTKPQEKQRQMSVQPGTQKVFQQIKYTTIPEKSPVAQIEKESSSILGGLLQTEPMQQAINNELLQNRKKRKKKKPKVGF
jgi:hypothetical protein